MSVKFNRYIVMLLIGLLCALIAAPVATASAAVAPQADLRQPQQISGPIAVVRVVSAAIYAGPGRGFWSLGALPRYTTVPVLGVSGDAQFWQVNTSRGVGYLRAADVNTQNTAGVPVVDPGLTATITTGRASVRSGPGIGAALLATLGRGSQVYVIGQIPDGSWLNIRYRYGEGWVAASLTSLAGGQAPVTSAGPRAVVNATYLNVRSGPGVQYSSLGTVYGGDTLPIVGKSSDGVWLLVTTSFGQGWINIKYVITFDYFGNAPVATPGNPAASQYDAYTTTSVNVRTGPNIGFDSLGSVPGRTRLTILGQSRDRAWWYVESPLGKGWVSKGVVRTMGNASGAPVIQ